MIERTIRITVESNKNVYEVCAYIDDKKRTQEVTSDGSLGITYYGIKVAIQEMLLESVE